MGKNNKKKHYSYNSDSDSDDDVSHGKGSSSSSAAAKTQPAAPRNINEALRLALERAANPGVGDEDPEVLAAPEEGKREEYRGDETADMDVENNNNNNALNEDYKARYTTETSVNAYQPYRDVLSAAESEENDSNAVFEGPLPPLPSESMRERAKYIPIRLTYEERKTLRLVNAAIAVSDYTTAVDSVAHKNKTKRRHAQLQYIVAFLSGLVAASDYAAGQRVLEDRNLVDYQREIQSMLEIARRYKVMNPDKLRSEYGKLVYLMQDAQSEEIQALLGVDVFAPLKTVYDVLEELQCLEMLDSPLIHYATEEILPTKDKTRARIQQEIKRKEKAVETLMKEFVPGHGTLAKKKEEILRTCLYSINDNNSFLNSNRQPVLDCIELLQEYFSPSSVQPDYSLGIEEGREGARLSHTHEMQYNYVLQSLSLWSAILQDMFRLWYLAEKDLLNHATVPYELQNTGQGLQRVQSSPCVYKAMHELLVKTQREVGQWVGTSVIHLGDHNVPNALVFIDKYTQVSRILSPLITTLKNLEKLSEENAGIGRYLAAYGGLEKAKKDILHDFFTHAFDGSGGDNFFDAGSCIDGRLTSAWNWCSQLSSKPYYPLFKLTGFLSFDGEFDK